MRRTQRLHERCADILGQTSVQAASRDKLRELLNRASGGVVFIKRLQLRDAFLIRDRVCIRASLQF